MDQQRDRAATAGLSLRRAVIELGRGAEAGIARSKSAALVRELGVTAIYVTHDQVEAMTLANRICLMKKGEIQQIASPRAIYEKPATSFVPAFIERAEDEFARPEPSSGDVVACGPFKLPAPAGLPDKVIVGVRPEDVKVAREDADGPRS